MQRAALFLLVGIGIGAAIALYYDARHAPAAVVLDASDLALPAPDDSAPSPSAPARRPKAVEPRVVDALAANPEGTVQRAALYVAAARSDVRELEALLAQADALTDE